MPDTVLLPVADDVAPEELHACLHAPPKCGLRRGDLTVWTLCRAAVPWGSCLQFGSMLLSQPQSGRKILFITPGESCPDLFKWAPGLSMEATVPSSLSVLRPGKEAKWGR